MEETKVRDSNTKTQLSLAAALFFSPLVHYMLKHTILDITETERNFITGYVKFGYFTLLLGALVIISGIAHYLLAIDVFDLIYTISIFILLITLIIAVVSILADINLIRMGGKHTLLEISSVPGEKKLILLKYFPIYNLYLWYAAHAFEKPNRRIKESILLWTIFFLLSISGSIRGSTIVLILIISRIASLMSDIDIIPIKTKTYLNILFSKNPEELRGYVIGFLSYLGKSLLHTVIRMQHYSLDMEIRREKEIYSRIIHIRTHTTIIVEYVLGICLIAGIIYFDVFDFNIWTYYVGGGLLILRYLVMALQLQHFPHLPLAREIVACAKRIRHIVQQPFISKP